MSEVPLYAGAGGDVASVCVKGDSDSHGARPVH